MFRYASKLFLYFSGVLSSDGSIKSQFLMTSSVAPKSRERKLEVFPVERMLEVFGPSISCGGPQCIWCFLGSVTGAFDLKVIHKATRR